MTDSNRLQHRCRIFAFASNGTDRLAHHRPALSRSISRSWESICSRIEFKESHSLESYRYRFERRGRILPLELDIDYRAVGNAKPFLDHFEYLRAS